MTQLEHSWARTQWILYPNTSTITTALFTKTKKQNQPRRPLADK